MRNHISLGRPGSLDDNPSLSTLVFQLYNADVAVVVAAGNDPFSEVSEQVPATYPEVIAVASTTAKSGSNKCKRVNFVVEADTASYFTTDGKFDAGTGIGVNVSAPGEKLENIGCSVGYVDNFAAVAEDDRGAYPTDAEGRPEVAGDRRRMIQWGHFTVSR